MNASFYGKCKKCGNVGEIFEELIPIEESTKEAKDFAEVESLDGEKFTIGKMFCRECSKDEPRSILNRS